MQTVRASNCIKSTCSVNITYLFTDVRWVASSNVPSRHAVLVSYSSLYGHFTYASEDVRFDKERAQFNDLANKLFSVHFLLNLDLALMPDDKLRDRSRNINNKLYNFAMTQICS